MWHVQLPAGAQGFCELQARGKQHLVKHPACMMQTGGIEHALCHVQGLGSLACRVRAPPLAGAGATAGSRVAGPAFCRRQRMGLLSATARGGGSQPAAVAEMQALPTYLKPPPGPVFLAVRLSGQLLLQHAWLTFEVLSNVGTKSGVCSFASEILFVCQ